MTTEAETADACALEAQRRKRSERRDKYKRLTPAEKKARALDRLAKRMAIREANRDYLETLEAIEAKQASEEKGRFGRGESIFDDRVTHGVVDINRDYHGCRNPLDDGDDGDVDAWRPAD